MQLAVFVLFKCGCLICSWLIQIKDLSLECRSVVLYSINLSSQTNISNLQNTNSTCKSTQACRWEIIFKIRSVCLELTIPGHLHRNQRQCLTWLTKEWTSQEILQLRQLNWKEEACRDFNLQPQYKHELFHIYFTSLHFSRKDMNSINWPRSQCVAS